MFEFRAVAGFLIVYRLATCSLPNHAAIWLVWSAIYILLEFIWWVLTNADLDSVLVSS